MGKVFFSLFVEFSFIFGLARFVVSLVVFV